jgi:hypothetical protein
VTGELLYKVAYDEAVRALSEQQGAIDSLRARAGLLFSAAAVTTSFLGAQALRGGKSNLASWLALLCFVVVAVASLAVLWPRKWEVRTNPRELIKTYVEPTDPAPVEELYRDLSLHMYNSYIENHRGLDRLVGFLQAASGVLAIEVVLWMAALAGRV